MAATSNRLNLGGLWLDGDVTTFNQATLQQPGQLGAFYEKAGKKYQLVLVDSGSNDLSAGDAVVWIDYDDFTVTSDISDVTGGSNFPAGVAVGSVTKGQYGFIQVRGPVTVKTDGGDDITAGDSLWVDPTTDGSVDSTAGGTATLWTRIGVATASDTDSLDTVAMQLTVPLNGA